MAIKVYSPIDFEDTSSGLSIDGDFAVDTSTFFVDVSTDRVGVGTSSPAYKLHVTGDTILAGASKLYLRDSLTYITESSGLILDSGHSTRATKFLIGGSEKLRIHTDGNVGVGTSSPSQKLDVAGAVNSTDYRSTNAIYITSDGDDTGTNPIIFRHSASEKMRITSGGNVLIGTTTDSGEKLQVSGSTSLGGDVGVDGDLDFSGGDQNKIITGSQESYTLPAQGTRMRILTLTTGTSCRVYIDSSENTYNQPIVLDIFYKSQSIGDKPQIVRVQNYQWHAHSNDIIFTSDGAASVGGVTHVYAEKVNHSTGRSVNIRKVEQFKGSVTILNGSTTDTNGGTDETVSGEFAKLKANGNIISTGNIGIGTTSPSERLSVAPDTDVSAEIGRVHVGSVGHNDYAGFSHVDVNATTSYALLQDSAGQTYLNSKTGYPINFRIDNSDKMRLFSNGNFAIGTTTDSGYKLDVSGSIHAQYAHVDEYIYHSGDTNTAVRFLDDSIQFNAGGVAMVKLTEGSSDTVTINPDSADVNFQVNGDTVANLLFVDGGTSNVGVGTSSPSHRLHVNGGNIFGSSNVLASNNVYAAGPEGFVFGSSTSEGEYIYRSGNDIIMRAGSSDVLTVDGDNSRVGIGTTSPSNKLHIVGDLFLKGSNTSSSTKVFHVQTGNSTSIMDFRNDAYAFFGCGQGGGSASGFIFRYNSTFGVQFTGYNYGNGTSPSYKPILMDTDLAGRSQGVYVNYGITGYTAPAPTSDTEFAVRGRGTGSNYTAKFEDSSTNPLLYIKDNGNVTVGTATDSGYKLDVEGNTNTNGDYYVNNNQGWSGTITIDQSPNPSIDITVEGGIITNVT